MSETDRTVGDDLADLAVMLGCLGMDHASAMGHACWLIAEGDPELVDAALLAYPSVVDRWLHAPVREHLRGLS